MPHVNTHQRLAELVGRKAGTERARLRDHQADFERSLRFGASGEAQTDAAAVRAEEDQQEQPDAAEPGRAGVHRARHSVVHRQPLRGYDVRVVRDQEAFVSGDGIRGGRGLRFAAEKHGATAVGYGEAVLC